MVAERFGGLHDRPVRIGAGVGATSGNRKHGMITRRASARGVLRAERLLVHRAYPAERFENPTRAAILQEDAA
jgi:hypothetical protein